MLTHAPWGKEKASVSDWQGLPRNVTQKSLYFRPNVSQSSLKKHCITSSSRGYHVMLMPHHVAVNVVRLVTVTELHLVELAIGVHVQWDAGDIAGVLVGLVIHIFGADGGSSCCTLSVGDRAFLVLFFRGLAAAPERSTS